MASDIEIAQKAKVEKITTIASKIDISEDFLVPYGHDKAKISLDFLNTLHNKKEGNLIWSHQLVPLQPGREKQLRLWD